MKSTRVYDFSLAANGAFQLPVTGSFFRIMSLSVNGAAIEVQGDTFGNIYPLFVGQGMKNQKFGALNLVNRSGNAVSGTLLVSDGELVDDRITGFVEVVDGGKNRTLSGVAFLAYANAIAVAANYTVNQLWNPIGSGKNLVVEKITVSVSTAQAIGIMSNSLAMTSLTGFAGNKKTGGAVSVSQIRYDNIPGAPGGAPVNYQTSFLGVNSPFVIQPSEPIIITPGFGLICQGQTVANINPTSFEFYEDAI